MVKHVVVDTYWVFELNNHMGIFLDALIGNDFIFLCIFLIYTCLIVLLRTFLACT
jgi:hypothetical protein